MILAALMALAVSAGACGGSETGPSLAVSGDVKDDAHP